MYSLNGNKTRAQTNTQSTNVGKTDVRTTKRDERGHMCVYYKRTDIQA